MYSVIFDDEAIEYLNKIEKPLKERIFNKILSTKENPAQVFYQIKRKK